MAHDLSVEWLRQVLAHPQSREEIAETSPFGRVALAFFRDVVRPSFGTAASTEDVLADLRRQLREHCGIELPSSASELRILTTWLRETVAPQPRLHVPAVVEAWREFAPNQALEPLPSADVAAWAARQLTGGGGQGQLAERKWTAATPQDLAEADAEEARRGGIKELTVFGRGGGGGATTTAEEWRKELRVPGKELQEPPPTTRLPEMSASEYYKTELRPAIERLAEEAKRGVVAV